MVTGYSPWNALPDLGPPIVHFQWVTALLTMQRLTSIADSSRLVKLLRVVHFQTVTEYFYHYNDSEFDDCLFTRFL